MAHASSPALSIVTPVYNGAGHLAETVESVLAQSFSDFEYLLIDDGSTDASPEMLAAYAGKDSRIRVIAQQNQGIARARNRGFAEARAAVTAFLDHDDVALPERMARQFALLEESPDLTGAGCFMEYMDEEGRALYVSRHPHEPQAVREYFFGGDCSIPTTCLMLRRGPALASDGLNPAYEPADDYEFLLRLLQNGHAFALVPETLQRYRVMPGNTSHKKAVAMLRAAMSALYLARQGRLEPPSPDAVSGSAASLVALEEATKGREAAFWTEYFLRATIYRNATEATREEEALLALEQMRKYGCTARRKCASRAWRHLKGVPFLARWRMVLNIALGLK